MIAIVDYGMGNLRSVYHALDSLGAEARLCKDPAELAGAERIVLPGVGAFRDCMANLRAGGWVEPLREAVERQRKPILGICLGMQVMAERGFEGGSTEGLGWIPGDVVRLDPEDKALRVPQVGWNDVAWRPGSPLFAGLPPRADFYFVHSYQLAPRDGGVEATCEYGGQVTAAVQRGNVFGTQFHPEKSQDHGQRLLENFLRWRP